MKQITFCLFFASLFVLQSCFTFGKTIKGSGNKIEETRVVENFTAISVSSGLNVEIKQGALEGIRVCGDDNIVPYIETKIDNGTLNIYFSHHYQFKSRDIRVYVTVPILEKINTSAGSFVACSGNWECSKLEMEATSGSSFKDESTWKVNEFSMSVSSGATIHNVNIEATSANIHASSGANGSVKGSTQKLDISANSGASLRCKELKYETLDNLNVSSGASIGIEKKTNYNISSGGNVY